MSSDSGPLSTPLGQFALGAFALVVGAALLFGLIGLVSDDGPIVEDDPIAGGPTAEDPTSPATTGATDTPTDGGATDTPTDGGATDEPTSTATDQPTQEPTDAASGGEQQFEPGTITIQVLDAWPDSSGPQDNVLGCLREAGYDSLIDNDAVNRYDATVVFFTPGDDNQARAQQVADVLGVSGVEEKPSNLSGSVPVHVVTGGDGESLC